MSKFSFPQRGTPALRSQYQSHASSASTTAVAALRNNPSKLEECQHQLEHYNPSSAKGFDTLLRYIAKTMELEAREISLALNWDPKEVEKWSKPEGHPPNSLIRQKVVTYALNRLKHG